MSLKEIICKKQLDFLLIVSTASLYLLNNFIFKKISTGLTHYFLICYFNDLICPLAFLAYVNIMLAFVQKQLAKIYQILIFCFGCGLVWEFIAPLFKKNSVTDFYDLLCYCAGGMLYYAIKQLFLKKRKSNDP